MRLLRHGESVLDAFRRNPVRLELEAGPFHDCSQFFELQILSSLRSGDFVSVIEDLQNHQDRAVYKAATDLLTSFFEPVRLIRVFFEIIVCAVYDCAPQVEDDDDENGTTM